MTAPDRRSSTAAQTWLPTAAVTAVALLLYGNPVPRLSEELYLPLVRRVADPAYLRGDWTFAGDFREHWLFDHLFAPLAGAVSISTFGWIGRLVLWPVLAWLLIRLGTRLGLTAWRSAFAVGLWLVGNQAVMGSEWIIGSFEAKTVAYVFLLGAFLAVTHRRIGWAVAFLGLTLSFHPAVGLWGAWGVGLALLVLPETRRAALRWSWLGLLLAIPGIIGGLSATGGSSTALRRFLVLDVIPYHIDPFFGADRLAPLQVAIHVLTLAGMLAFNVWAYRRARPELVQRFLLAFQVVAAIPFVGAFVARVLHIWSFLQLMPLRSFPLFVPLIFFFQAVRVAHERWTGTPRQRAGARRRLRRSAVLLTGAAVGTALLLTAPLVASPRLLLRNLQSWTRHDSTASAFSWVRTHTPRSTRCIVPVDRQDAFARTERPIVANWQAVSYDRLPEWKRRMDALVGGAGYFHHGSGWKGDLARLHDAYDGLSASQVQAISSRYDADCLVSETDYPFPVLHRDGPVTIYRLPGGPTP